MLWFKVQCGVLRIVAGKDVRLVQASAVDRLRLLWVFRNFSSLPIQVLSPRQCALVDKLYAESTPASHPLEFSEAGRVIGTIERPAGAPKKPSVGEKIPREVALPRVAGMSQDWAPRTSAMTARGNSSSVLSGAAAQLRALASTISSASHKTGKVLTFPARTRVGVLPVRRKLVNWWRGGSQLLRKNLDFHAAAGLILRRRPAVGLLIALLSVLAFALTRDSSRPTAPGPREASSAPTNDSPASPREAIRVQLSSASGLPNSGEETIANSSMAGTMKQTVQAGADGRAGLPESAVQESRGQKPAVQENLAVRTESSPVSEAVSAVSKPREPSMAAMPPAVTTEESTSARVRLEEGPRDGIIFPNYPASAWKSGKRGRVTLRAQVAPAGAISNVEVLSGDPALAAAATHALRRWRYEEQSAPGEVVVHFDFINPEAISVAFEY
jgi:TonB family protein